MSDIPTDSHAEQSRMPAFVLPADDGFLDSWLVNPADLSVPLIWADYLEERDDSRGDVLRRLIAGWAQEKEAEIPQDWKTAIVKLPHDWRRIFAWGCAFRCQRWIPAKEQEQLSRNLLVLLTLKSFDAADAARSAADAARSAADAAWSAADAAWSAADAARSAADAAERRWQAHWLEVVKCACADAR